jgi:DNA-binding GntR family transcriptional regulator
MIARGELAPGAHILQETWASQLGVSRVPVREALKMLAAEHLLVHDPHRGYFVADIHPAEKEQIYRIRQWLELEIVRSIRWPNDEELHHLSTIADSALAALRTHDVPEALSEGQRLYFAIYDLSPLTFMVREVKRFWSLADPYRIALINTQLEQDPGCEWLEASHERLLRALAKHDMESLVDHVVGGTTLPLQRLLKEDRERSALEEAAAPAVARTGSTAR